MNYPFNTGDLLCSGQCTSNYLDNNIKVPWEDLRYMFGEIIYGGHIVEDWDRRLAFAYLVQCMNDGLLENAELFPNFAPPPPASNKMQVCLAMLMLPMLPLYSYEVDLESGHMYCLIMPSLQKICVLDATIAKLQYKLYAYIYGCPS